MKKPEPQDGGFRPNFKRQLLFAGVVFAAVLAGYAAVVLVQGLYGGETPPAVEPTRDPQQPENLAPPAPKAWYKDQPAPPQLVEIPDMPLLPEPDAHPAPQVSTTTVAPAAPLAYEEALPQDVYVAKTEVITLPPTPAPGTIRRAERKKPPETVQAAIPAWLRNAVPFAASPAEGPTIAIVIDDMGIDQRRSSAIMDLPPPLTVAFLTYAKQLPRQTNIATAAGHELLVHVAMEPTSKKVDPGPHVLLTAHDSDLLRQRLEDGIDRVPGAIGINNHMGSRFTEDSRGMGVVMDVLKRRGLLFLDSRTSPKTVGPDAAFTAHVPVVERNVFLDNKNDKAEVLKRLAETERLAIQRGYAIAIGHPRDGTIAALQEWIPQAERRGLRLVPLSVIAKKRHGLDVPVAGNPTLSSGG